VLRCGRVTVQRFLPGRNLRNLRLDRNPLEDQVVWHADYKSRFRADYLLTVRVGGASI